MIFLNDLFFQIHQGVQQILQIVLTVEFQLKATLAFAVDDLYAPAQRLAQVPLTLGYIVHFQDDLLFLREAERKSDLTDRTMALLEKAKDALANSYMDKIEQGFRNYTQRLCPRQLGSVMVDKDLQPHIDVRGAARDVESFSAGLADSILLCMRLALVDALFGEETPFLILDDPFVNLDDEHTRRALAMLQEMAETHQILYLVCNTGRV